MLNNISVLVELLRKNGYKVWRDDSDLESKPPFVIYEFSREIKQYAGNTVVGRFYEYQISYITYGTEKEITKLTELLENNHILVSDFSAGPFDENDLTLTQFNGYVRCLHGAKRI